MKLTEKQGAAVDICLKRYKDGQKCTIIAGYAGAGKSTCLKYIIAALPDIDPDKDVAYATFTGKAAQVLRNKGHKNTFTLHKLLYEYTRDKNGMLKGVAKAALEFKVVVVDEISMLPMEMAKILANMPNLYIIGMGDPGQLPCINPADDNHLLDSPHVFLDEIMRQAAESEIIQTSMQIRSGQPLLPSKGKEVMVLEKKDLSPGMYTWANIILCATNATRNRVNGEVRSLLGFEGLPQEGEKIIFNKNYWGSVSEDNKEPIVNGSIGTITKIRADFRTYKGYPKPVPVIIADFISEAGEYYNDLVLDRQMIVNGTPALTDKEEYFITKNAKKIKGVPQVQLPLSASFGYAVTTWKAQGSEWPNVLVLEEGFPFEREEHKRFMYTACTRPSERLVVIKK